MDINLLRQIGQIKKFHEDEYIFNEGDPGNEMFIVLSGSVGIFIRNMNGFYIKASEIGPGNFFGEMSILEELPRSATVIASADTIAVSIDKSNFIEFISKQPDIAYHIMKGLSSRVRSMNLELKKHADGNSICQLKPSKTNLTNETNLVINELFPPLHKQYSFDIPGDYQNYVFDSLKRCPVCSQVFTVKKQKLSKLSDCKVENDFRQKYEDFEPLIYSIWVCPHCYYSNLYYEFDAIPESSRKTVKTGTAALKSRFDYKFSTDININDVFTAYYLALYCTNYYPPNHFKLAKLWIQLTWLYKDMEDAEMVSFASNQALEKYTDCLHICKNRLNIEQEQKCCIIIAELLLLQGDRIGALKYLSLARKEYGNPGINKQAEERILSLEDGEN